MNSSWWLNSSSSLIVNEAIPHLLSVGETDHMAVCSLWKHPHVGGFRTLGCPCPGTASLAYVQGLVKAFSRDPGLQGGIQRAKSWILSGRRICLHSFLRWEWEMIMSCLYSPIKTFFKKDRCRRRGEREKKTPWKGKNRRVLLREGYIWGKMTILDRGGGGRDKKTLCRFSEWKDGKERRKGVACLGLFMCGIYMLTLIAFYCVDAFPRFSFSSLLSRVSAAALVRSPNWLHLHLLSTQGIIIPVPCALGVWGVWGWRGEGGGRRWECG